jgi:hypothetical protein
VLSSTNVDGDDETAAESQFVKEDIIPVAAILDPNSFLAGRPQGRPSPPEEL